MPLITAATISRTLPRCPDPAVWSAALDSAMSEYEINTHARISSFLAQTGYESGQYRSLVENLNFTSPGRLVQVWPRRFPSASSAAPYVGNPAKLANFVYANRLGNGPASTGDGFRFRGRGIIQLTGRANYDEASRALRVDLIAKPDLLAEPEHAARSAAWFWSTRGLNALADDETDDDDLEDFREITRRINGGAVGLQGRLALMNAIEGALA